MTGLLPLYLKPKLSIKSIKEEYEEEPCRHHTEHVHAHTNTIHETFIAHSKMRISFKTQNRMLNNLEKNDLRFVFQFKY